MIKDLNIIKKELKGYIEVDSVFSIKPNTRIKYITLKDNEESFYLGGTFERLLNDRLFLYNSGNTWAVPIKIKDDNCNTIYNSRFFIESKTKSINKEIEELQKIIKTQQRVINKLTLRSI
mgnify:CR=1 FL=1